MKRLGIFFLTPLAVVLLVSYSPAQTPAISTPGQIKQEFASVPCKDRDRLKAVKALFEKMGADSSSISIDKFKKAENLVISKAGTAEGIIVIGAHYDKVEEGCGAIDNWSGIVALAHLYRTLKDIPVRKSIVFVAFGNEEDGLNGSRAMVDAIAKDKLSQYCAMINLDSFGLAYPQVMDNVSDPDLTSLAATLAKEMKMSFSHSAITEGDADSSSFLRKKIPAVTLHGMSNQWASILHSNLDIPSKVNDGSVYLGYRLSLAMVLKIDETPCAAYR